MPDNRLASPGNKATQKWFHTMPGEIIVVRARTRSEARACLKKKIGKLHPAIRIERAR